MRQWTPSIDMNFDGVFTIGDVGLWFNWLFFLPGDWVVRVCLELFTPLGTFFEMNPLDSYGGTFSGVFSGILWVLVIYGWMFLHLLAIYLGSKAKLRNFVHFLGRNIYISKITFGNIIT